MMRLLPLLVLVAACTSDPAPAAVTDAPEAKADTTWTVDEVILPGVPGPPAMLMGVRVGLHTEGTPAYDRVVFDVDRGEPKAYIGYVDTPVRACGSGTPFQPEGDGALQIRLIGAQAHTDAGEATLTHSREKHDQPTILETLPICDFEGEVTWVLGVAEPTPFRAFWLQNPLRLVVDVQHP